LKNLENGRATIVPSASRISPRQASVSGVQWFSYWVFSV
jgi:hypothetical protein